jgi:hypothetical protein
MRQHPILRIECSLIFNETTAMEGLTFSYPLCNHTEYQTYEFIYHVRYWKEGNDTHYQHHDWFLQRI